MSSAFGEHGRPYFADGRQGKKGSCGEGGLSVSAEFIGRFQRTELERSMNPSPIVSYSNTHVSSLAGEGNSWHVRSASPYWPF